jgi:hypothetical protein
MPNHHSRKKMDEDEEYAEDEDDQHWSRDWRYISAAVFLGVECLWALVFFCTFLWFVIAPVPADNYDALVILAFHAAAPVAVLYALERIRDGERIAFAHSVWIAFTAITDSWSIGDAFRFQTQGTMPTMMLQALSIISLILSVAAYIWYMVIWWRQEPRHMKLPRDPLTPPPMLPSRDEEDGRGYDNESTNAPMLARRLIAHQTPRTAF